MTSKNSKDIIPPGVLLAAYAAGIFPMAEPRSGELSWYSPDPRGILPLSSFRISRSLRQTLSKNAFIIEINRNFEQVIRECADRDETWISDLIVRSYCELHRMGHAHSVETWKDGRLVGGLYGVSLGGAFFGESMFSAVRDASKIALVVLVDRLCKRSFSLLDTQWVTPHLARFGAREIPRDDYMRLLEEALKQQCEFP